ncbi:MAG: Lrp/AsnC ligand binding domain-containing protein [Bacteroidales bacterium]|nr:Lrp/AsnC ligand binding domain-containing protein [Bacteroidales bacterium]
MTPYAIDEIDRKILSCLLKDARIPFLEIARECGISGAAIHQRVHKLEDAGIISGYSLLVQPSALGLDVCAFIMITLSEDNKYSEVVASLKRMPEIVECHFITGKADLLIKVYCTDNNHLMDLLMSMNQKIPYVKSTDTLLSLNEAFDRQVWVKKGPEKNEVWK